MKISQVTCSLPTPTASRYGHSGAARLESGRGRKRVCGSPSGTAFSVTADLCDKAVSKPSESKDGEEEKPQGEAEKEKEQAKRKRKSCIRSIDGTALPYPATRLEEMLVHLRKRGFAAWEGGLMPVSAQVAKMRIDFQTLFEGPDIFCDDRWTTDAGVSVCKDGNLDSKNGFGRLGSSPFPLRSKFLGWRRQGLG